MSENITNVRLLNVPLEADYKHTFYFENKEEQENYFKSAFGKTFSEFSYQRKDSILRVNLSYDDAIKFNYVMYQNTHYNNKWFYAFITKYEWKRDDVTELTLATDVMQTWLNDYIVNPSFIEREHTNDDTIGSNTYPENLEVGEYICNQYNDDPELKVTEIVVGTTVDSQGNNVEGGNYNGIYSGVKYYSTNGLTNKPAFINSFLKLMASDNGKVDAVQNVFIVPKFLTTDEDNTAGIEHSNTVKAYEYTLNAFEGPTWIKNKKCLSFPYRYLLVSNNNGASAIYKYENFINPNSMRFSVQGALTPGCSIRLIPKGYKRSGENDLNNEEGLNLGKYPICNFASDVYTNWLTQNSVNIGLNIATGVGQIVAGAGMAVATAGTGAVIGGTQVIAGVSSVVNQLTQIHQMSFTPPQSNGNVNCGDVITASETNTFHYYQMSAKEEYLRIIDNFFTVYGYKCNRVKAPNVNHRERFWYTKTIDVNITGNFRVTIGNVTQNKGSIPSEDLQKIKDCYNNGITFWKDRNYSKNYNASNPII